MGNDSKPAPDILTRAEAGWSLGSGCFDYAVIGADGVVTVKTEVQDITLENLRVLLSPLED